MTPTDVRLYFDDHPGHPGVWRPTQYSWALAEVLMRLAVGRRRVLDVGCGAGNLSLVAAAMGADVHALDALPEAVEATKQNARSLDLPVQAEVSDGTSSWHGGRFEVVVCNPPSMHRLHDLPGRMDFPLTNSYLAIDVVDSSPRLLAPLGVLLISVSGAANSSWLAERIRMTLGSRPAVLQRCEAIDTAQVALDIDQLLTEGLLVQKDGRLYWDQHILLAVRPDPAW